MLFYYQTLRASNSAVDRLADLAYQEGFILTDKTLFSSEGVFRLDVQLYNIQGFRGEHRYTIDDFVTIINSKHNGVGKTTLYDCIRFLCDSTQVDKEEQEFFLNLNETEGLFSITRNGVTHGFILVRNKPPVFYRQFEGDEVERNSENFTTASQDIGILAVNGALLNIFSKEVNLFSGSSGGKNYQLVKEITTHQQTEEMLELLERSININQSELGNLRAEKRGVDAQLEAMPYFLYVEQLESLLQNEFYEDLETFSEVLLESLGKLKEVEKLNFNSSIEELFNLEESLNLIEPTDFITPSVKPLEALQDIIELLDRIEPTTIYDLNTEPLERMMLLEESLNNLTASGMEIIPSIKPLEVLLELTDQLDNFQPISALNVSSSLPTLLSNICIKLGQMTTACNQEARSNKIVENNKKGLESKRVCCPIREEVYLIDGKCVY